MRREQHSPFAVWLICFLVLGLFAAAPVWAADKTGSTHGAILGPIVPQSAPSPITPYVAQAYSVVGPISVLSVSSRDIVLYTGANNLGIDLTGKSVTVIDQNSQPLTLSAVKKGTSVYVCRKASNVVVVVLPDSNSTTIGEAKR
jgi:hypothetical protein